MKVSSVILNAGVTQFDITGRSLGRSLTNSGKSIKPGMVDRLVRYASKRMEEAGFPVFEEAEVSTVEGEGYYHVSFKNNKGGYITLNGVVIGKGGHPCWDHGFSIGVIS